MFIMSAMRAPFRTSFVTALLVAPIALAQETDFDAIQITATPAAGNITMLQGSGGNIAVSVGEDGVLMVDDQFLPLADKIKAAINQLGGDAPTFLLNTHYHGDHSGSNEAFADTSIIVAHDNVRVRMALPDSGRVPEAMPVITYGDDLSIHFNGEEVRLIHLPTGHTDGDTAIWFTDSNVIHMGDEYVTNGFPFVDLSSGGNVAGLIRNLEGVLAQLPDDITIIPGHGNLATKAELAAWADMVETTAGIVTDKLSAGMSIDAIQAQGLPAEYEQWGRGFISEEAWITAIHTSTTGAAQ
jgi:glyoxylase-like metal-dependent hydrolase (beta-lactamase superfamily II)